MFKVFKERRKKSQGCVRLGIGIHGKEKLEILRFYEFCIKTYCPTSGEHIFIILVASKGQTYHIKLSAQVYLFCYRLLGPVTNAFRISPRTDPWQ